MTERLFNVVGSHRELFEAKDADEIVLSGPAGTGKSYACILMAHLFCLKNPGVRVLFVRKTLESLKATGLDTYRQHIAKELLENEDVKEYGGSNLKPPCFEYSNGSEIRLGGMDNPGKVLSAEYDLVYVQEATQISLTDWEILTTRIRNGKADRQQIIGDCNPDTPKHWLKVRSETGQLKMVNTTHKDNPAYFNHETGEWTKVGQKFLNRLSKMTGVRKLRYYQGIWAAAEGLIYEEFDPAIHVLPEDFKIPTHWTRYWAIDFGVRNPFVCQFWAEDEDGRLYLYKELYYTNRDTFDHCRTLINYCKYKNTGHWKEVKPRGVVADHDANARSIFTKGIGLSTTAAKKDVDQGIQVVKERLKLQADGKPRIFFLENVVIERDQALEDAGKPSSTLEEISGYVWDKNGDKVSGKPEKETPLKENDHGMDAMRYMVMERDRSSRPRLRVFR